MKSIVDCAQPTPPLTALRFTAKIDPFNIWDSDKNDLHFTNFRAGLTECINGCGAIDITSNFRLKSLFDESVDPDSGFSDSYVLSFDALNSDGTASGGMMLEPNVKVQSLIFGLDESDMTPEEWKAMVQVIKVAFATDEKPKKWEECVIHTITHTAADLESIYVDYTSKPHKFEFNPFLFSPPPDTGGVTGVVTGVVDDLMGNDGPNINTNFNVDDFIVKDVFADLTLVGCYQFACSEFIFVGLNAETNWKGQCNSICRSYPEFTYFGKTDTILIVHDKDQTQLSICTVIMVCLLPLIQMS